MRKPFAAPRAGIAQEHALGMRRHILAQQFHVALKAAIGEVVPGTTAS